MTLQKRLDRMEGAAVKPEAEPCAIIREIVQPSANGPELVGMMLRPLPDGDAMQIDRAPGETEAEARTRFAAIFSPDQRMKGV